MPSVNDSPFQITVEGQKRGSVQWREVMRLMDTYLRYRARAPYVESTPVPVVGVRDQWRVFETSSL
jgi:hypothetical protein